jgi:hypothetical protein
VESPWWISQPDAQQPKKFLGWHQALCPMR